MTTTHTQPTVTAQNLNRVLAATGLRRGEWIKSSRVKGWGKQTQGFEVERLYTSENVVARPWMPAHNARRYREVKTTIGFLVHYRMGDWTTLDKAEEARKHTEAMSTLLSALLAAGFNAKMKDNGCCWETIEVEIGAADQKA